MAWGSYWAALAAASACKPPRFGPSPAPTTARPTLSLVPAPTFPRHVPFPRFFNPSGSSPVTRPRPLWLRPLLVFFAFPQDPPLSPGPTRIPPPFGLSAFHQDPPSQRSPAWRNPARPLPPPAPTGLGGILRPPLLSLASPRRSRSSPDPLPLIGGGGPNG